MKKYGFTLIELMIVVAIISFLAMLTLPSFLNYMAKSKRAEAYLNLGAIYAAQKAYWAENDEYTDDLTKLNWKPEGEHIYSYGFPGQSGTNYFSGKSDFGQSLVGSADKNSFRASAAADIDGDGEPDVITVDDKHNFKIEKNDLG